MKLSFKRDLDFILGEPLIFFARYVAKFVGFVLRRDHSGKPQGDIALLKMAGGGSLVIAYPSLLAIRESIPGRKFYIVCTPGVAPFAETLGVFDEIIILNDKGFFTFFVSLVTFFKRYIGKLDTIINYEVHSRLTTIISLFTCARNRIGFFRHDFRKFQNINTHSIFFNLTQKIPDFYDEIARTINAEPIDLKKSRSLFKENIVRYNLIEDQTTDNKLEDTFDIGVGAVCSDLALERMMPNEKWKRILEDKIGQILVTGKKVRFYLYGAPSDRNFYENFTSQVFSRYLNNDRVEVINFAGAKPLGNIVNHFAEVLDEYYGVDTSLIHYIRLLGIKSNSFWGPTSPFNYLRAFEGINEKTYYLNVPCSPCVHFVRNPPCKGNNICMEHFLES